MGFRDKNIYVVRFISEEERQKLMDMLVSLGFADSEMWRGRKLVFPETTCTFALDIDRCTMQYLPQPFICAWMVSTGIRFYSVPEFCRLAMLGFPEHTRCPVFHVPHSGGQFPEELMESVCVPCEQFMSFHEMMCDTDMWKTIPKAYYMQHRAERFPVSRLLCDVERFLGPEEIMEKYGMGFCYECAWDGTKIKNITPQLREKTLMYYEKHHRTMDRICEKFERIVLFDLHSYKDEIVPPGFLKTGEPTPDICIGTDGRFTPPELTKTAVHMLTQAGYTVKTNYPYAGCFVPDAVLSGKSACDYVSIMLEFHKRVYMDRNGKVQEEKLAQLREILLMLTAECVTEIR